MYSLGIVFYEVLSNGDYPFEKPHNADDDNGFEKWLEVKEKTPKPLECDVALNLVADSTIGLLQVNPLHRPGFRSIFVSLVVVIAKAFLSEAEKVSELTDVISKMKTMTETLLQVDKTCKANQLASNILTCSAELLSNMTALDSTYYFYAVRLQRAIVELKNAEAEQLLEPMTANNRSIPEANSSSIPVANLDVEISRELQAVRDLVGDGAIQMTELSDEVVKKLNACNEIDWEMIELTGAAWDYLFGMHVHFKPALVQEACNWLRKEKPGKIRQRKFLKDLVEQRFMCFKLKSHRWPHTRNVLCIVDKLKLHEGTGLKKPTLKEPVAKHMDFLKSLLKY
jgi:hypothetical protein